MHIIDHTLRLTAADNAASPSRSVHAGNHGLYLEDIAREAARGLTEYGLIVLPGLELTDNHPDPDLAAHALAIGLDRFVSLENGIEAALVAAGDAGAAPGRGSPSRHRVVVDTRPAHSPFRPRPSDAGPLVHRYELFNRTQLFRWVSDSNLPHINR